MDIREILDRLAAYDDEEITIMEVCGTHTVSIAENAIPSLISKKIRLVSGPGCPVCVTVPQYIDRLCSLAQDGNTVVTFGDMLRVPGTNGSLSSIKSANTDIRMVYSPMEVINAALLQPEKNFVFAAIGFETTTPVYALLLDEAEKRSITNLRLLTALKTMPPIIDRLCKNGEKIDGFLAPGHVAAITGSEAFEPLAKKYSKPFVVSGFTAEEILASIYALTRLKGRGTVLNLYKSTVKREKNQKAYDAVNKYFEPHCGYWRGIGAVENSAMVLKQEYSHFDAGSKDIMRDEPTANGCRCPDVITGRIIPWQCPLFSRVCTPQNPKGACMVSAEGACSSAYLNRS